MAHLLFRPLFTQSNYQLTAVYCSGCGDSGVLCQALLTSVPLEAEGKSNNNLNRKLLCKEMQFMAPVDLRSF